MIACEEGIGNRSLISFPGDIKANGPAFSKESHQHRRFRLRRHHRHHHQVIACAERWHLRLSG